MTTTTTPTDLTRFQLDILRVIERADGEYGLGIKAVLDDHYGESVNHGRLYTNLDQLVGLGLVAKSERDKRTYDYEVTGPGQRLLRERRAWLAPEERRETEPATIADGGDR